MTSSAIIAALAAAILQEPTSSSVIQTSAPADCRTTADRPKQLRLTSSSTLAIGQGSTGTGITTDQRGDSRVSPPDLGADEFIVAVSNLVVSASPANLSAGGTTSLTITAEDALGNVLTGFSDSVTLADSLGGASFSAVSFTGGLATVTATLDKAGTQMISATDSSATITGTSSPVTVTAAAAAQLVVSFSPSSLTAGSSSTATTYSAGLDYPIALAVDSSGNLYVVNQNSSTVEEFAAGSTSLIATYSAGLDYPDALAFDSSGNLYVASDYANNYGTVEKFAPGSTTVAATYTAGVSEPDALALDTSGNLYVVNLGNNTVEEFAAGSTTPSATYTAGISSPHALAVDGSGNLYVANYGSNTVEKFSPGSTTVSATYTAGVTEPNALALDSSGNLYVANEYGPETVEKFAPNSTTASVTYSAGLSQPFALAIDAYGDLYVANNEYLGSPSYEFYGTVTKFAAGSTTASATYVAGQSTPYALDLAAVAIDPYGDVYVAKQFNSTVEEFSPPGAFITAEDQFNNVVTGFSDSVTLSDNLGGASFSAVSFTEGVAAVPATLTVAGVQTITATDSTATLSGTSGPVTVTPAALSKLQVSASPSSVATGGTTSLTITAEDQYNNVVTGFSDSVTLSDSLSGATFSANPVSSFSSGTATVTATLHSMARKPSRPGIRRPRFPAPAAQSMSARRRPRPASW